MPEEPKFSTWDEVLGGKQKAQQHQQQGQQQSQQQVRLGRRQGESGGSAVCWEWAEGSFVTGSCGRAEVVCVHHRSCCRSNCHTGVPRWLCTLAAGFRVRVGQAWCFSTGKSVNGHSTHLTPHHACSPLFLKVLPPIPCRVRRPCRYVLLPSAGRPRLRIHC